MRYCTYHTWQHDASIGNTGSVTPENGTLVALDGSPIQTLREKKKGASFTRWNKVIFSLLSSH